MTNTILDFALLYVLACLSIIPIRADGSKAPAISSWKEYQSRRPTQQELHSWFSGETNYGIAIIGGLVSCGLEILDFEADAPIRFFEITMEALGVGDLLRKLVRVATPSGGIHFFYRCSIVMGNQKLAQVLDDHGKRKTLIETRGEGGYVVAVGSPAACHRTNRPYQLISGDLCAIPNISPAERDLLLTVARSFDQVEPKKTVAAVVNTHFSTGLRPGDDFNLRANWSDILGPHGWKFQFERDTQSYWCRPGKLLGVSATTNYKESDLLYIFSSNADPFEPETAYSKFAAYAFLNHGGDFQAAARELKGNGFGQEVLFIESWKK